MNDPLVEIVRSFSFKISSERVPEHLNRYEGAETFCSAKLHVNLSEAEATSEKLFALCKQEVHKSVEDFIATGLGMNIIEPTFKPEFNSQLINFPPGTVIGDAIQGSREPESEPQKKTRKKRTHTPLQEQVVQTKLNATEEAKKRKAKILELVPGLDQTHLKKFYIGWFGANNKTLPVDPSEYLIPLELLERFLQSSTDAHAALLSGPGEVGKTLGTPADGATVEPPKIADSEVFSDPLLDRFKWESMETVCFANALIKKWKHTEDQFADYLASSGTSELPESELRILMLLLYHSVEAVEAYDLWRRCQAKDATLSSALIEVETIAGPVTLGSDSAEVEKAIKRAFAL